MADSRLAKSAAKIEGAILAILHFSFVFFVIISLFGKKCNCTGEMNEKITNLLNAIIFIAQKENTAEADSIKENAVEISNILNKENKN